MELLYTVQFRDQKTIAILHGLDRIGLAVRLLIDAEARPDLIESATADAADPRNGLTVELTTPATGYVQILSADTVAVG